jgi:hypothetical protein
MKLHMMRAISSPSSSTTGFATLIRHLLSPRWGPAGVWKARDDKGGAVAKQAGGALLSRHLQTEKSH